MANESGTGKSNGKIAGIPREAAGAVAGAAIGSVAGPVGAVIGGVVGAIVSKRGPLEATPNNELASAPRARLEDEKEAALIGKNGQGWIRTSEGVSQRIYSPPRLATSVPTRV